MTPFAKIFETEAYGQMLITKELDDDKNPSVKLTISAAHVLPALGLVSAVWSFDDNHDGFEDQQNAFDGINSGNASVLADRMFKQTLDAFKAAVDERE